MKTLKLKFTLPSLFMLVTASCFNMQSRLSMDDLHEVVLSGNEFFLERMLESGANPDVIEDEFGNTPLHYAADNGLTEQARTLLRYGAAVDPENVHGNTPLFLACATAGDLEIVHMLVEKGANVNKKGSQNYTPLHMAADKNNIKIAKYLIEHGAKVNSKDEMGHIPLHTAVFQGHKEMTYLLLKAGSKKKTKNKMGWNAMKIAKRKGDKEIVNILNGKKILIDIDEEKEEFEDSFGLLCKAIKRTDIDKMQIILSSDDVDINQLNSDGNAPLHIATRKGNSRMVEMLLDAGADVNIIDIKGNTCLHITCQVAYDELTNLLLTRNANPNVKSSYGPGVTPLDIALNNQAMYEMSIDTVVGARKMYSVITRIIDRLLLYGALKGEDIRSGLHDSINLCAYCGNEADKKCTSCKKVYYCNRSCQKSHWKQHKHECNYKKNKKK